MSFIDLITGATINRGVDRWRATDGAVLIDVRSEEEYGQGHIPGSVNIRGFGSLCDKGLA